MSLPQPPIPLFNHCTVIHNETLYAYQPGAFQALPLAAGAEWEQLPLDVSVSNGRCVVASLQGQDALFIVGGSANATEQTFSGLQRFTFADQTWLTATPQMSVIQNRQMHGAAYLNATSSILVYGGFQDNSFTLSSQTFTISTSEPYNMRSYPSSAPPVMNPMLIPWNASHAMMIGGGGGKSNEAWLFSEASGWTKLNLTLPSAVPDPTTTQGALVDGADGSKVLELFNMAAVPNLVTSLLMQAPQGSTNQLGSTVATRRRRSLSHAPFHKRQQSALTVSNWPKYDGTNAPSITRTGFALAQDPSGLIVMTGGQAATSNDVLCFFNQSMNAWVDAQAFFGGSTTTPANATASDVPSATNSLLPTASAASPPASATNTSTVVGGVLGGIFGMGALLLLLFLLLRWSRNRKRQAERRTSSSLRDELKSMKMDFADRGLDSMPAAVYRQAGHQASNSNLSTVTAFVPQRPSPSPSRQGHTQANDSVNSQTAFLTSHASPGLAPVTLGEALAVPLAAQLPPIGHAISPSPSPAVGLAIPSPLVTARTEPRADEGWSQYWANGTPRAPTNDEARMTQYTDRTASSYTVDSGHTSSLPRESAEVPPLQIPVFPTAATFNPAQVGWQRSHGSAGVPGGSTITTTSGVIPLVVEGSADDLDFYNEDSSGQQSWDPVGTSEGSGSYEQRPASSVYPESVYPHPGDRIDAEAMEHYPGVAKLSEDGVYRASTNTTMPVVGGQTPQLDDERGMRSLASRNFAAGDTSRRADGGDMSWLKLGK